MRRVPTATALALSAAMASAQTPYRVKDIYPGANHGSGVPRGLIGDAVILMASEPTAGFELWLSDGTEAGTHLIRDLYPGPSAGVDDEYVMLGGELFFRGRDNQTSWELWKSDGTAAGTVQVRDIYPGVASSSPGDFAVFDGEVYFVANESTYGSELWKSDGTTAGTQLVVDINPNGNAYPSELTVAHGRLYFLANYVGNSNALYRTDGTAAGTELVLDLAGAPKPTELEELGGELYFIRLLTSPLQTQELWKVGGAGVGAVQVAQLGSWSFFGADELTDVGDKLFFTDLPDLWVSDGTAAGTHMLPATSGGYLTDLNGTLFFRGYDSTNGTELWTSDGTPAGTTLVKDINPGAATSQPLGLCVFEGQLYLQANDGTNGVELWKSDGTHAGTVLVADIDPIGSSQPCCFLGPPGRMFFAARDTIAGSELWALDTSNGATAYCTAGTSASGCRASIAAVGTPSATAASDFTLMSFFVEGGKDGLFFFGTGGRQANTWGNGTSYKCVVPPVQRAALLSGQGTSGACDGTFALDLNAHWCPTCPEPLHNPGAGATFQAQLWYRDPWNTSNRSTSLSSAVELTVAP